MYDVPTCVFCNIINGGLGEPLPAKWNTYGCGVVSFRPLHPVVPGHRLFVPEEHFPTVTEMAIEQPMVFGSVMLEAARYARQFIASNIIVNNGDDATQTVYHAHVHVIPRTEGDGLKLPWSDQVRSI